MNVRDSEHIIAELSQKEDYALTNEPETADLILINTCSVRERPVHKLFSEIGGFEKLKKKGAKIGVVARLRIWGLRFLKKLQMLILCWVRAMSLKSHALLKRQNFLART